MNSEEFIVSEIGEESIRVDRFVASLGMFTRSQIARRSVSVRDAEGKLLKFSRKLKDGESVTVEWDDPPSSEVEPEPLDLKIVYEDKNCLVIDKEQGVVVHPAHGHIHGTLVQGLLYRYSNLDSLFQGDRVRPGIVHRLDKDTSGLLIAAKNPEALEYLSRQFRDRSVEKQYLAITRGVPAVFHGEIDTPIGRDPFDRKKFNTEVPRSKDSLTRYKTLEKSGGYALLQLSLLTGRTHQLRVHLKSIGCPILGDPVYGKPDPAFPEATLMLHSWKLAIDLEGVGIKRFTADLPGRMRTCIGQLDMEVPSGSF